MPRHDVFPSKGLGYLSGLSSSCAGQRNRKSRLKYIGMSVRVLALMIGSAGASRADDAQPMDVITQADGQTSAVTISVPTGQTNVFGSANNAYAGLSKNDYDKLSNSGLLSKVSDDYGQDYNVVNAKALNVSGGGRIVFGKTPTDFSPKSVNVINIENGTLSSSDSNDQTNGYNGEIFRTNDSSNVTMNISPTGVLSIETVND